MSWFPYGNGQYHRGNPYQSGGGGGGNGPTSGLPNFNNFFGNNNPFPRNFPPPPPPPPPPNHNRNCNRNRQPSCHRCGNRNNSKPHECRCNENDRDNCQTPHCNRFRNDCHCEKHRSPYNRHNNDRDSPIVCDDPNCECACHGHNRKRDQRRSSSRRPKFEKRKVCITESSQSSDSGDCCWRQHKC